MNQSEKRIYLIRELLKERNQYIEENDIPPNTSEQKKLLRALFNVRPPRPISDEFLSIQDSYLRKETEQKGITELSDISQTEEDIYLWQGDITTLRCDAVVNAANSGMTGCYIPCHNCIDNCIYTYSGIQLRNFCNDIMQKQGEEERVGQAKITPAFNLPCGYVIHTVGAMVEGRLKKEHCQQLKSCYLSCLELADKNGLDSIAFCCISTGVFGFPNDRAAEIAVETVREYKKMTNSRIKVIFNVFKDYDKEIYMSLLSKKK